MAATDIVFNGLTYAAGRSVQVVICGLNMGQYTISPTGDVTVPINSDPDGLGNGAYFRQFDVGPWDKVTWGDATTQLTVSVSGYGEATIFVPVTIGFVYTAIGQTMRPVTEAETKLQSGAAVGTMRRVFSYGLGCLNTVGLSVGTNLQLNNADPVPFKTENGTLLNHAVPYTGIVYSETEDVDSYDGFVYWISTGAYPCTITSLTAYLDTQPR